MRLAVSRAHLRTRRVLVYGSPENHIEAGGKLHVPFIFWLEREEQENIANLWLWRSLSARFITTAIPLSRHKNLKASRAITLANAIIVICSVLGCFPSTNAQKNNL